VQHAKRMGLALAAACCLIAGVAAGGSLLTAGAATSPAPNATGAKRGSNEAKAHEAGESAARETAEDNGTAGYRHRDGGFRHNESPAHESGESATRESDEGSGNAAPAPPQSSTSGT
jgi:hypothetical protein